MRRHAKAHGALPAGQVRVVVLEPDGRVLVRDFEDPKVAKQYVDDVRWEPQDDRGPRLVEAFSRLE